jgi:hypothetical protein
MNPGLRGRFSTRAAIGLLLWALLCLPRVHASTAAQELGPSGLRIEPLALRWGPIHTVDLAGRFAYVGMGRRLVVYDLRDPEAPRTRGHTELLDHPLREVKVDDGMAFVIDFGNGFHVFDVRNPDRPLRLAELEVRSEIGGFPLGAERLFVHEGVADLLMVVGEWLMLDVSEAAQPRLVRQRPQSTIGTLMVVDVGDPATPRAKATIPLGLPMLNMAVEGRMLYLTDGGLLTTARLGVAGDLAPLGTIDLGLAVVGESSIEVRRSMVFVGGANGVRVIDASIPTALDEVGRLEGWPAGSLALHDDDRHMLLTGRTLGLSTEPWGVLSARFDPPATVTPDPSRPTPMATATPEATSTPRGTSTPSPSATATPVAPASPSADPSSEPSPTPAARLWLPCSLRITQ